MKAFTLFSLCGLLFITPALAQSNLEPLNHPGTSVPEVFQIGTGENNRLCNNAEGGTISMLKRKLRKPGVDFNSPAFWAIKCEKETSEQLTEPNLLQVAIWTNNTNLVDAIVFELDNVDDLNIILTNELGYNESILDWFDRQIIAANSKQKIRLSGIRETLVTDFNAKSLNELRGTR